MDDAKDERVFNELYREKICSAVMESGAPTRQQDTEDIELLNLINIALRKEMNLHQKSHQVIPNSDYKSSIQV